MDIDDPKVREWLNDFRGWFQDMTKHLEAIDRQTGSSREQARATADGYQKIATAIERGLERGFRELASAVRDSNR